MGGGSGSSKGPSSDDVTAHNPAAAFTMGGPSSPTYSPFDQGAPSFTSDFGGPPNQNTVGASIGAPSSPSFSIGGSTSFDANSTATSGAGDTGGGSYSPFASLTGSAPQYGGSSGQSGAAPLSFPGTATADASGASSLGGITAAQAASPVSAAGAGLPTGVNPAVAPDPTQQQKQAAGGGIPQQGGSGGFSLDSLLSSAGKSVASNPLGLLAGGAMAYNAYQANQAMKNIPSLGDTTAAIQQQASQLNEQGQQLAAYLQNGNLPPGLKAGLDQATEAAKARVIQNFANQGMATDPTKNSALAAQLAAIDQQAIITTAQIGQQLMSTGVQESGMASNLYSTLAKIDQTQTQRIGQSIANFAAALSGKSASGNAKGTISFG